MAIDRTAATPNKRRLWIALLLAGTYLVAEVIGGLVTGSLALLADAGHMLTDVGGLALALFAIRFAEKPATPQRTYGYYRAEILAALANAVVLVLISLYILYEAYQRFQTPAQIESGAMLAVAAGGLLVNVIGMALLKRGADTSLNLKGAYFEVVSDMLSSLGVIVAALVIRWTGWVYADPLVSAAIGLFILPRTWALIREAVSILLEGTPSDVNLADVRQSLGALRGITDVHDLHVWTLTSGVRALSAHCVVDDIGRNESLLSAARELAQKQFTIGHVTLQVESTSCKRPQDHA